jgi:hypothetical protein
LKSHSKFVFSQKQEKLPNGPFHTPTLLNLLQETSQESLSKQEIMEYLKKCIVVVPPETDEVTNITTDTEDPSVTLVTTTNPRRFDNLDLEEMFQGDEDIDPKTSDTEESEELLDETTGTETTQDTTPPAIVTPTAGTVKTRKELVPKVAEVQKKRKERCCEHDNYYCAESYADLAQKSYFIPSYMNQRDNPVHFCTGINGDGSKCGVDFTDPAVKITANNPVHACQQAVKIETECVHALCHPCFVRDREKNVGGQGRSSRRRCQTTLPVDENTTGLALI